MTSHRGLALRIEGLSKTFPAQRALAAVDLEVRAGEVHALVGQNGSGKSTLIKILSGFHTPDPGARAWLGEREMTLGSPTPSDRASILFIHQDRALVPTLTVRENFGLDDRRVKPLAPFPRARERDAVRAPLATFDLDIDPEAVVGTLTPFEQSAVEIARALGAVGDEARLLVLDEPTAALDAADAERLFATLRRVNERGIAILYVSHYLTEVLAIADRISVLRDGRRIAVRDASGVTEGELVELIVGESVERPSPAPDATADDVPLRMAGVTTGVLDRISLEARAGEVLGITGLVGSGYEEIASCLAGTCAWAEGSVVIDGTEHDRLTPAQAVAAGVVTMPADRLGSGLIPQLTVAENITLPRIGPSWRRGRIRRRDEEADVLRWLDATGVVPRDPHRTLQELSGGNQQKVMLAKALRLEPRVLVLAEPTRAVDAGGSAAIRRLLTDASRDGRRAVIVASADAEELEQVCHRVLVTRDGAIAAELIGREITKDRILSESQFARSAA